MEVFQEFNIDCDTKDYYEILGVDPLASHKEIKKQFNKLSVQYHPDKCPDDIKNDAVKYDKYCKNYQSILSAYTILSKKNSRKEYDELYYKERRILDYSSLKKYYQSDKETIMKKDDILTDTKIKSFTERMNERNSFVEKQILDNALSYDDLMKDRDNHFKLSNMKEERDIHTEIEKLHRRNQHKIIKYKEPLEYNSEDVLSTNKIDEYAYSFIQFDDCNYNNLGSYILDVDVNQMKQIVDNKEKREYIDYKDLLNDYL